ncbi:uncharacterized protein Z520_03981 [Fonsecaea multimorphosa CBS 102226]|uniref:Uncharacterized protein n=1 Tax=Fonsecaea multimorphosa CBS 102226 TaxID=1442371 RepID=A0A0D2HEI0_9EURO|nr:uncharacterized protein Z520_03981 [Fonsecaea multimorphosa CBS 102226]KIY00296.1 hypothetical protein Z520_03981 [Fonsecaea multimorphosa CBS 102226]OAL27129.1 hypothetical protein AYO22_03760 [Fonsecaea multimorphosa]
MAHPSWERYVQRMKELEKNPPPSDGKAPAEPLPATFAGANEWDKMLYTWKINGAKHKEIHEEYERLSGRPIDRDDMILRFLRLMEQFAASGELRLPVEWLEKYPEDYKYQLIAEQKRDQMEKEKK